MFVTIIMKLKLNIIHVVCMHSIFKLLKILSKPFEWAIPVLAKIGFAKLHLQSAVVGWRRPSPPVQLACSPLARRSVATMVTMWANPFGCAHMHCL